MGVLHRRCAGLQARRLLAKNARSGIIALCIDGSSGVSASISPLKFRPKLVPKIWGARRLETVLGKRLPDGERYGESWEVSAHPGDETPVEWPPEYAGAAIPQLAASEAAGRIFGKEAEAVRQGGFPLLYKFIDADAVLSVQVHPDDAYARKHENDNGKTECWVIIDAAPGSLIYKGFKPRVDARTFDALLAENRVEECLNSFAARPGDVVFIPARTVHAIGAGILLSEIQQSSDVTYRVYDWGRVGDDGRPRALHVRQAREVTDFSPPAENAAAPLRSTSVTGGRLETLVECASFALERLVLDLPGNALLPTAGGGRFSILSVIEGSGVISWAADGGGGRAEVETGRGDSFLVPAAVDAVAFSAAGPSVVLNAYVP